MERDRCQKVQPPPIRRRQNSLEVGEDQLGGLVEADAQPADGHVADVDGQPGRGGKDGQTAEANGPPVEVDGQAGRADGQAAEGDGLQVEADV